MIWKVGEFCYLSIYLRSNFFALVFVLFVWLLRLIIDAIKLHRSLDVICDRIFCSLIKLHELIICADLSISMNNYELLRIMLCLLMMVCYYFLLKLHLMQWYAIIFSQSASTMTVHTPDAFIVMRSCAYPQITFVAVLS